MSLRFAILIVVATIPGIATAWCMDHPSLEEEFKRSQFVFVGKVIAESVVDRGPEGTGGTNYIVEVQEPLRGKSPQKITIFSENSSGRFTMTKSQQYLLFIHSETVEAYPKPVFSIYNCGHSGTLPQSQKVLNEVRRLAKKSDA